MVIEPTTDAITLYLNIIFTNYTTSFPGIAMLFSAGTFLYVATVHVLPELTHTNAHAHSHTHTLLPMQDGVPNKMAGFGGLALCEVVILAVGAMLPVLLTMGHEH